MCGQEGGHLVAWETQVEFEAVRDMLATIMCKYPTMVHSWTISKHLSM